MALTVKALHIGDIMMDWSFLLFAYKPGRKTCIPITSFLILGAGAPILVDTGILDVSIFDHWGYGEIGFQEPEQDLVKQLREEGVEPGDVRCIIHTHVHIDHTGNTFKFPNARIAVQRSEMAYAASYGFKGSPDLPWYVANFKRLELIDGDTELFSGIKCVLAPGHTGGTQHVEVQTDRGKMIMVGDTCFDIPMQLENKVGPGVIWPSGGACNQPMLQDTLYKLKNELKKGSLILPTHAYELFDQYKLGQKRSDKRREYAGFPDMQWPPVV